MLSSNSTMFCFFSLSDKAPGQICDDQSNFFITTICIGNSVFPVILYISPISITHLDSLIKPSVQLSSAVAHEQSLYHKAKTPLFPVFSRFVAVSNILYIKHFPLDCHIFSYIFSVKRDYNVSCNPFISY